MKGDFKEKPYIVDANLLNVRIDAGYGSEIVSTIPEKTELSIIDTKEINNELWGKAKEVIASENKKPAKDGWVNLQYCVEKK